MWTNFHNSRCVVRLRGIIQCISPLWLSPHNMPCYSKSILYVETFIVLDSRYPLHPCTNSSHNNYQHLHSSYLSEPSPFNPILVEHVSVQYKFWGQTKYEIPSKNTNRDTSHLLIWMPNHKMLLNTMNCWNEVKEIRGIDLLSEHGVWSWHRLENC